MGFFERLFGRKTRPEPHQQATGYGRRGAQGELSADEQAIERYRYMLRTAPPETIEQAHEEAFAKLTPEQRAMALRELTMTLPEQERVVGTTYRDDPKTLARMATRAEIRQPGTMERTFGGLGGVGMGGLMAGSLLSSIAGGFIGSMIAQQFFDSTGDPGSAEGGVDDMTGTEEAAGDFESGEEVGGDLGADFGGDFGGEI
jgi:hypothetical protein